MYLMSASASYLNGGSLVCKDGLFLKISAFMTRKQEEEQRNFNHAD